MTIIDEIIAAKPELEGIREALVELSQLTITTKGEGGKEIRTVIKLTGDIESTTSLTGDQLAEYHERMAALSVDIMRTYAQIFIQVLGVFIPWAGISVPPEVFTTLTELVKTGFGPQPT